MPGLPPIRVWLSEEIKIIAATPSLPDFMIICLMYSPIESFIVLQ